MNTHNSVAARVREHKERRPELYCAYPPCLWRLTSGPCPKHPVYAPAGSGKMRKATP